MKLLDPIVAGASRALLAQASRGGAHGLSILIYHRVLAAADPLFPGEVDIAAFSRQLEWLKRYYTVLPLLDAVRLVRTGSLPARAACITFDDGYADNETVALPVLRAHGLCATFFVATGFLDGGRMWNDSIIELLRRAPGCVFDARPIGLDILDASDLPRRRLAIAYLINQLKYLPMAERAQQVATLVAAVGYRLDDDLMMRSEQVLALRKAGMEIGAHTINHPILAAVDHGCAHHEIAGSKRALEHLLNEPIPLFAYPNGKPGVDYHADHVDLVRQLGFEGAVSTAHGGRQNDAWQLPRFLPWARRASLFNLRMLRNLMTRAERA